jgi:hypothetical protein
MMTQKGKELALAAEAIVGSDGTDGIRVTAEAMLERDPSVTAQDVADAVRESREEWSAEKAAG